MRQSRERTDPVDREYRRRRWRCWALFGIVVYFVVLLVYWGVIAEVPVDYVSQEDHFKYGSIGSDSDNGIPYWIWRVLPEIFSEHLPDPEAFEALPEDERDGLAGYAQFGYVFEEGRDTPIGFSKRRDLVTRVGLNCALCHVSTVRVTKEQGEQIFGREPNYAASRGEGARAIIPGMPANTLDLQAYFQFLFDCAEDERFTTASVMAHIDAHTKLNLKDRLIYQRAVNQVRSNLLTRRRQLNYFDEVPHFGPGRVDTFTPYKNMVFRFPYDGTVGTADFPSNWNQGPREGMQLHWDGNNRSVFERNISASLGALATPVSLDMPRMLRVAAWIGSPEPDPAKQYTEEVLRAARTRTTPAADEMQVPKYPFAIDRKLVAGKGKMLFQRHCASCHDWNGSEIGKVVPIEEIGTDRARLDSYTRELAAQQYTLGVDQWWRFRNFRKTNGYANMPLDGLWARAPYLHNGSVPTLRQLLSKAEERKGEFYRGNDEYDPANVGFKFERPDGSVDLKKEGRIRAPDGRILFRFDASERGNGNAGHEYATDLNDEDKDALLEYLKTL